jgi:hypothetical protein
MKYLNREIQFLHPNFFFKHIKLEVFREKYFNYFTNHDFSKQRYIFSQEDHVDYVYFIKEGEVEINLKTNLLGINDLIIKYSKLIGKSHIDHKNLVHEFKEFSAELSKKHLLRVY